MNSTPHQHTTALVLMGHGSLKNPDSSAPCHLLAAKLRAMRVFDRVLVGFWKEEPSWSRVLAGVDTASTYVVPLFMSEGYFGQVVMPRELEAHGPWATRLVHCGVVGTHPKLTDVLLECVETVLARTEWTSTALVIVGHGTKRHARSSASMHRQVAILRERALFSEVEAVFLDESPRVEEVYALVKSRNVVVVPMFAADGYHTREQIPSLLGLDVAQQATLPVVGEHAGRRVWCTSALGLAPGMVEIVLERVREQQTIRETGTRKTQLQTPVGSAYLLDILKRQGQMVWGQVRVERSAAGIALCHRDDPAKAEVCVLPDLEALRQWCRTDVDGTYRRLSTAPTLRRGWRFGPVEDEVACRALEMVYPGRMAELHRRAHGEKSYGLEFVAGRHTGELACVRDISASDCTKVMERICGDCLCVRYWEPNARKEKNPAIAEVESSDAASEVSGLVCLEPCPELLNEAATCVKEGTL